MVNTVKEKTAPQNSGLNLIKKGKEYEARQLLLTPYKDYTVEQDGLMIYSQVLRKGIPIIQGYIKKKKWVKKVLTHVNAPLGFTPDTIRLRKMGKVRILTFKDEDDNETEFELTPHLFTLLWPYTHKQRVKKKRLIMNIGKVDFEVDAFIDRLLLIAEREVKSKKLISKVPLIGFDITNDKNWSNKNLAK